MARDADALRAFTDFVPQTSTRHTVDAAPDAAAGRIRGFAVLAQRASGRTSTQ